MSGVQHSAKTVLVVEDDYGIRQTLKEVLEFEGYQVATAANGKQGLERLRAKPKPCLVLLDIQMPVMNGLQFLDCFLLRVLFLRFQFLSSRPRPKK